MKNFKVMFTSWHFPNAQTLLDTLVPMTPGCSGKWKNMEATTDPNKADYFIVIGGTKEKIDQKRALYFGQHPVSSPAFKTFKNVECLASYPLDKFLNPGEVWIDKTYDELKALEPPKKKYDLCNIITYQTHRKTYRDRIAFMESFVSKYPNVHMYGRPSSKFKENKILSTSYKGYLGRDDDTKVVGTYASGKNILIDYRYSLEFDIGLGNPDNIHSINYLTERFYDAILLWVMPIYYGSINAHEFIPENSFRYVDISNPDIYEQEVKKVIDIVNSDFREQNIDAIKECRELLLDKYNTFPYVWQKIQEL